MADMTKFKVGDKVLIAKDAWCNEPGDYVSPRHLGNRGVIDKPVLNSSKWWVKVGTLVQIINDSCLTLIEDVRYEVRPDHINSATWVVTKWRGNSGTSFAMYDNESTAEAVAAVLNNLLHREVIL